MRLQPASVRGHVGQALRLEAVRSSILNPALQAWQLSVVHDGVCFAWLPHDQVGAPSRLEYSCCAVRQRAHRVCGVDTPSYLTSERTAAGSDGPPSSSIADCLNNSRAGKQLAATVPHGGMATRTPHSQVPKRHRCILTGRHCGRQQHAAAWRWCGGGPHESLLPSF